MAIISRKIFLDAPNVGKLEKEYLNKAIDTGYVSTVGPFIQKFENKFAAFLGVKNAVATQNGTASLHLALLEAGIKKGDEVIVPALTFIASVNPVIYVKATPVFADIDINTWNIDPQQIKKHITKRTKALIPVHLYGNPCAMDEITSICKKYGIAIIEDATESLGAKYANRHTGTLGSFGCYSFNGNKTITTGGGGMIVGNSKKDIGHIRFLVNQARDNAKSYFHSEVGFNYRMTNIEAALGLAQMAKLKGFLKKKQLIHQIYAQEFKNTKSISLQKEYSGAKSSWWLTCITFNKEINLSRLQKKLLAKNIPTRRIFTPIVEFPPYKGYKKETYSNSYQIYNMGLCLPSSTLNQENDIYFVCQSIKEALK